MKLIDISHTLNEDTPIYPGDYKFGLTKYKTIDNDNYCSFILSSCLHTGTHIDMPMHLTNDERTAADFPLTSFTGEGVLLDVRGEDVITMRSCYKEMITEDSVVLLFTGFDKHYSTEEYFSAHPIVSDELGEFLISKGIKILGMDTPSPDRYPFNFHKELLENHIFVLENLTNLQMLLGIDKFTVMALPLKISAEASFVRAVCIDNSNKVPFS